MDSPEYSLYFWADLSAQVLVVDPERKRLAFTAKKTLVSSTLPIVSKIEDARPGIVTHAVVIKAAETHIVVEFYNNLKAIVPGKELR